MVRFGDFLPLSLLPVLPHFLKNQESPPPYSPQLVSYVQFFSADLSGGIFEGRANDPDANRVVFATSGPPQFEAQCPLGRIRVRFVRFPD